MKVIGAVILILIGLLTIFFGMVIGGNSHSGPQGYTEIFIGMAFIGAAVVLMFIPSKKIRKH